MNINNYRNSVFVLSGNSDFRKTYFTVGAIVMSMLVGCSGNESADSPDDNTRISESAAVVEKVVNGDQQRIIDLAAIKKALESYKKVNGNYPMSEGFDGLHSSWGKTGENWIDGLVPDFIDELPHDRRNSSISGEQYLYKSDGNDYKLIAHGPENCEAFKLEDASIIDPSRDCWALGFWTEGGSNW